MIGGSPEQVERQLEDWARQAGRYQEMSAAVSAVSATGSSPDGVVRVAVNASGAVSALELTDRIREQSGSAVAAQIMATIQWAQAKQATIGGEQSTIDIVVSGYEQRFPRRWNDGSPSAVPVTRTTTTSVAGPALGRHDTGGIVVTGFWLVPEKRAHAARLHGGSGTGCRRRWTPRTVSLPTGGA